MLFVVVVRNDVILEAVSSLAACPHALQRPMQHPCSSAVGPHTLQRSMQSIGCGDRGRGLAVASSDDCLDEFENSQSEMVA